jgi:hypothetical protein
VTQFAPDHPAMRLLLEVEELIMWMDGLEEGLEERDVFYAEGYSGPAVALILKCAKIYEALVDDLQALTKPLARRLIS